MASIPTLAELVREVILAGMADARDPLRQIGDAERLAGELSHLGNSLVGYFVEQARSEGLSWADIGAPRGLSRQGAQQRYASFLSHLTIGDLIEAGVLRQFADSTVAALRRAESYATRLGRDEIDSGDILLGLLDDDKGLVVAAIRALGADPAALRSDAERPGDTVPSTRQDAVPVGSEARRALDGAVAESRGHRVSPGHLLLGVLRNPAGPAGRALGACGITKSAAMGSLLAVADRATTDRV